METYNKDHSFLSLKTHINLAIIAQFYVFVNNKVVIFA